MPFHGLSVKGSISPIGMAGPGPAPALRLARPPAAARAAARLGCAARASAVASTASASLMSCSLRKPERIMLTWPTMPRRRAYASPGDAPASSTRRSTLLITRHMRTCAARARACCRALCKSMKVRSGSQ